MSQYTHLLIGLDLSSESTSVLQKAVSLAKILTAKVSLIHVIEPLTFAYAGDLPVDLLNTQQVLEEHSRKKLQELAHSSAAEVAFCDVTIGPTGQEMRDKAKEIGADLIVVGSHGRHGFALLLGSTASELLHGAECDVLAIRI